MAKYTLEDMSKELDIVIIELLISYTDEVAEDVEQIVTDVAKEAAKQVKANANSKFKKGKGGRHYANGWRAKVVKGRISVSAVVYNANKPQLTHLLENGHAKADGVGRVPGRPHIAPVNEWAEKEVVKRVTERLQK